MPQIVPITKANKSEIIQFFCGIEALDSFLKKYARQNHEKGIGTTYLLLLDGAVIGYYTISMGSIEVESLPKQYSKGLPKYQIGIGRVGRLAVASDQQRKGYGQHLLFDAIDRVFISGQSIASFAVVVDAKDDTAKAFYLRYGFIPFVNNNLSLFLPLSNYSCLSKTM